MIERVLEAGRVLLPWVAFTALLGIGAVGDIGPELKELLIQWGPGLLIFLVVAQHVPGFVRAAQRQADAMTIVARESQKQADAITAVARDLEELPRRDEMKFEDLRIGQELMLRKLGEIEKRLAG